MPKITKELPLDIPEPGDVQLPPMDISEHVTPYYDTWTSEQRLLWAILFRALVDVIEFPHGKHPVEKEDLALGYQPWMQAPAWLLDTTSKEPFTVSYACEHLNIPLEAIVITTNALLEARDKPVNNVITDLFGRYFGAVWLLLTQAITIAKENDEIRRRQARGESSLFEESSCACHGIRRDIRRPYCRNGLITQLIRLHGPGPIKRKLQALLGHCQ